MTEAIWYDRIRERKAGKSKSIAQLRFPRRRDHLRVGLAACRMNVFPFEGMSGQRGTVSTHRARTDAIRGRGISFEWHEATGGGDADGIPGGRAGGAECGLTPQVQHPELISAWPRSLLVDPSRSESVMAEFIEVPIDREDGSLGLHYVNIGAISYVDLHVEQQGKPRSVTVYLDNGYWFTLSGPKADELLRLVKDRQCTQFDVGGSDN
jgi:hypothetical protein